VNAILASFHYAPVFVSSSFFRYPSVIANKLQSTESPGLDVLITNFFPTLPPAHAPFPFVRPFSWSSPASCRVLNPHKSVILDSSPARRGHRLLPLTPSSPFFFFSTLFFFCQITRGDYSSPLSFSLLGSDIPLSLPRLLPTSPFQKYPLPCSFCGQCQKKFVYSLFLPFYSWICPFFVSSAEVFFLYCPPALMLNR